jgi:hypothetical protein
MSRAGRPAAPHVVVGVCIPNRSPSRTFADALDALAAFAVPIGEAAPQPPKTTLLHSEAGLLLVGVRDSGAALLELSFSGDLLTLPDDAVLEPDEVRRRDAISRAIPNALRTLAVALEPIYGAVEIDRSLPDPQELATTQIGPDLYLGRKLLAADSSIESDLRELFPGVWVEEWATGLMLIGWRRLRPDGRSATVSLQSARAAADRLSRAVMLALSK